MPDSVYVIASMEEGLIYGPFPTEADATVAFDAAQFTAPEMWSVEPVQTVESLTTAAANGEV